MQYLLDIDICSYVIRARDPGLLAVMQDKARSGADISISAVTWAELRSGAERSRSAERLRCVVPREPLRQGVPVRRCQ